MEHLAGLSLSAALPRARFKEFHHRTVDRPIADVWPHCLDVQTTEVRTLGPLFALRNLPATITGGTGPLQTSEQTMLDVFAAMGFAMLRRDEAPVDGRAVVLFGAAGKFWSPMHNHPTTFDDADEFLAFDEPGFAKTVARLEAIALDDGTTRIETETWVDGTDAASTRKFAAYWAIVRLPSGLIRRSWLAAIDRRASAT